MALLSFLERARTPVIHQTATPVSNLAPMAAWQNQLFGNWPGYESIHWATEAEVLGLPVVGGFINLTNSLLLQMPLHAYRTIGFLESIVRPDPPVVQNPAPGPTRTFGDFIGEYIRDMLLYGNYVAILGPLNAAGWPEVMVPVPPAQWSISIEGTNYWYLVNGIRYEPEQMFHVTMNQQTGSLVGQGIIALYPGLVASSVATERWAALYFEGGAVPPGVIKHPNPELTQKQADDLKAKMKAVAMKREWAVAPGGTELEVLSTDAEQAQLNETRKVNSQELAMALGIPGALLGLDSPSLTYRNITDVFQQFITTTLMNYLVPLEQQLSLQCLPRGTAARFLQSNVLRPDLPARMDLAVAGFTSGLLTRDEARVLFDIAAISALESSQPNAEVQL
jgi:HK97 family phage portal protein